MNKPKIYRQGDVILIETDYYTKESIKDYATLSDNKLVIASENGNRHVLNALVYHRYEQLYVVVEKPTPMTHPQHPQLIIEPGVYEVRFVRDYALRTQRPID